MKYKTIGAFKNVQNVPYCKAASDLNIGMGVILDKVAKTATVPTSENNCNVCHYIVSNIIDQPETRDSNKFVVQKGEYVRADDLMTVANMEIEFSSDEINTAYTEIAVKDMLVFDTNGKLVKTDDVSNHVVFFQVIEKTGYCGKGILAEIVKN